MEQNSTGEPAGLAEHLSRHWLRAVVVLWLGLGIWLLAARWGSIQWLALGDTDDNLRFQQVRDWLAGQSWYDLRQYRLNAPEGADIHWSRLVDLPIAGLLLLAGLFMDVPTAERFAVSIAPLLPLFAVMVAMSVTARRLVHPLAHLPVIATLSLTPMLMVMFQPLRVDHHGWQLAFVALAAAALADPKAVRGGILAGLATALSLVIGMEMLPFLAIIGGVIVLRWVADGAEAMRMRAYGAMLALGVTLGFALFASEANRMARCDALSPVWLSAMLAAGALCVALSLVKAERWQVRLGMALLAGLLIAGGFAASWPQCLSNIEQISPEAKSLWFNNIREVRPIYRQPLPVAVPVIVTTLAGLLGHALLVWRSRSSPLFAATAGVALMALLGGLMLLWQGRASAGATMLATPGIAALACIGVPWIGRHVPRIIMLLGGFAVFLAASGLAAQLVLKAWPGEVKRPSASPATKTNRRCSTIPAHRPLNRLAPAKIFTFVDLSPRLITLTKHSAITGPYHRNHRLIVDVHHAFRGSPDEARGIIARHKAAYLLICPGSSESTLYVRDAPDGFYGQLAAGKIPAWLEPVVLPERSPFRLWRVKASAASDPPKLDLRQKSPTSQRD